MLSKKDRGRIVLNEELKFFQSLFTLTLSVSLQTPICILMETLKSTHTEKYVKLWSVTTRETARNGSQMLTPSFHEIC